ERRGTTPAISRLLARPRQAWVTLDDFQPHPQNDGKPRRGVRARDCRRREAGPRRQQVYCVDGRGGMSTPVVGTKHETNLTVLLADEDEAALKSLGEV